MDICQLIRERKSCRAYLNKQVDSELIHSILETARWAPSGVNHQPAKVAVLRSETKNKLSSELIKKFDANILPNPDYEYCPKTWPDLYKSRRKACGLALYSSLGISLEDAEKKKDHRRTNYHFFHAPVGLIILIDRNLPKGSWMDVGMFIQNILLAAQKFGLSTCPQATFAEYPDVVREVLDLQDVDVVCGIAMGYEDPMHPLNSYRTAREPVDCFTKWYN